MKKWFGICLMAGAFLLQGCGAYYFKLMKHPDGRLVECRVDHYGVEWNKIKW